MLSDISPRSVIEDGHSSLVDALENLHTVLLTFCLWLPLSQLRDNSHFPHPSHCRVHCSIITLIIIFIMPAAFQGLLVTCPKLKETLYFHDYGLQKRPKRKRELQSCSLPRFAKCLSMLALCNISCSVFAGYFLPQDMYPKASPTGQDVESQIRR